jgi:anti-sigma B factor antagonist
MQIVERQAGDVTILDLTGRLILDDGFEVLRQTLSRLVGRGHCKVLMNFAGVTYLDSAGVGLIACKYLTLHRYNGELKLCSLHARSYEVLHITKLLNVFESYDSEAEALASFKP